MVVEPEILKKPLDNLNVLNISNTADIHQLIDEVAGILNSETVSASKIQNKIDRLISSIENKVFHKNENNNEHLTNETSALNELARQILLELAINEDGTLLISETHDGFELLTKNNSYKDNNNPRERAKLEKVLDQLIDNNFISERGTAGSVFGITEDGYTYIDSMK